MKEQKQSITVRTLPEQLDAGQQKALYRELENCINVDRPALVLDCSRLGRLETAQVTFCCAAWRKPSNAMATSALQRCARKPVKRFAPWGSIISFEPSTASVKRSRVSPADDWRRSTRTVRRKSAVSKGKRSLGVRGSL